jgi:hypothetical protein
MRKASIVLLSLAISYPAGAEKVLHICGDRTVIVDANAKPKKNCAAVEQAHFRGHWFLVVKTDDVEMFIDPDAVTRNGNLVQFWARFAYAEPDKLDNGMTYQSARVFQEIDCKAAKFRNTNYFFYSDTDPLYVVHSVTTAFAGMMPIVPGSIVKTASNTVCK